MVIEESAASGMYGPWDGVRSKMYRALCTIGETSGPEGRGGSYGYGKAGLIRGSSTRTVVAYTCFREREDDPGITRRLLGMTYWGSHDFEYVRFTGFARFGMKKEGGKVVPFENEEADAQADRLGLKVRTPDMTAHLGTTFLLIEPTVTAEDLVVAIERSWWPALEDRRLQFNASVHTTTGDLLHPRPRRDPVLRTFIKAYEVATHPGDCGEGNRYDLAGLGVIGLVSEPEGWSYAEQTEDHEESVDHCSLVALVRKPRMVVEYHRAARNWSTPPYIRGVFIADPCINESLRETEPKDHNRWDYRSEDARPDARKFAKRVYDRIREKVRQYKNELKPPARPPEEIELPLFDRLMKRLLKGPGKGTGPDPTLRPFSIQPSYRLEVAGPEAVRVVGKAQIAFSDHFEKPEAVIEVYIRYKFVEDDRAGEKAELEVLPPSGFDGGDGRFHGTLRRSEQAMFTFKTQPYRADWSGRLITEANILDGAEA